jgi:DHA1 family bicyclomycin/chloramphenicol resistance-like MFS transporter
VKATKAAGLSTQLLVTLGAISILGPFGTDVYLPAFPQMAASLGTSAAGIQLTLTAFTVGMALGQLTMGSLSDRLGRKPLIVLGCLIMFAASGVAALAQNLGLLILCCAFIGIAASAGMVCGRAMVSDLATGHEAAKGFSVLGILAGIGPILGPVGGALIMQLAGWRSIFGSLSALALAFGVLAFFALPETLDQAKRHSGGLGSMFATMGQLIRNKNFVLHAVLLWCGFAMMFAYISASPFVLQNVYGLTPLQYTLDFGANGIVLMITGALSAALIKRVGPAAQVRIGVAMQLVAAVVLVIPSTFGPLQLWAVIVAFALVPSSMGFVFGPVTALALQDVRHAAGTALALMGALQFVLAGVAAFVVGLGGAMATEPLVWSLALLAAIASSVLVLINQRQR